MKRGEEGIIGKGFCCERDMEKQITIQNVESTPDHVYDNYFALVKIKCGQVRKVS